jgi:TonB-linked SusC/RagA family outer membrane protein
MVVHLPAVKCLLITDIKFNLKFKQFEFMKKTNTRGILYCILQTKVLRMMKLTAFLFFISTLGLIASASYSQNKTVTINRENALIKDILQEIEDQSGYFFIYNNEFVDVYRRINIHAQDRKINELLDVVFKGQDITYSIKDRRIILSSSGKSGVMQQQRSVSGKVTDTSGGLLPGVTVVVKGTTIGTITSADGTYSLSNVSANATLVFSFVGMKTREVPVEGSGTVNVVMEEETIGIEEVVAVGYGTQKKVTLTGAVVAVKSDEIVATKNENVQNMLTGKLPGVRVAQKTSEPGVFTNDFDIRGFGSPLIVIDGVPRDNMVRLDPNDIESVSVLKDASAAVYGVRAGNGVVLITTKKGQGGALELNYSGSYSIQKPSGLPKTVGAVDWLTLTNEKYRRGQGYTYEGGPAHSQEEIDAYRNGSKQSIDWYPEVIQNIAPQSQHNLSASGSAGNINYFISMGYLSQEGFFKSGDLNYERYNVRSNVTAKITDQITAELQISGIMDERNQPYIGTWEVFKALWRQNPIDPMYANNNPEYLARQASGTNAIAVSDADISGYQRNQNKWFQSSFSLSYDFPFVKGLTAKGMISYDYRMGNNKSYQKEYSLYTYNEATDTYPAFKANSPSRVRRSFSETPFSLLQASLNYQRSFDEKHNVNALLLYEEQTRSADNFYAQRDLALTGLDELLAGKSENQQGNMNPNTESSPNNIYKDTRKGLVGRLNYDYKAKYMAEFSFRYDASSRFSKNKQWGFFPGASLGWRISEEDFFKNADALRFVSNLKLRASYAQLGDDNPLRYQFVTGYNFPATKGGNNQGLQGGSVFDGNFISGVQIKPIANPYITWLELKTLNLGLDADLWHGLLGVQLEVFRRNRDGIFEKRLLSVPGSLGAELPQENLNSDQVKGLEIVLSHRNRIRTFGYNLSGNFTLTRTRLLDYDQAEAVNSYDYWKNHKGDRYNDIIWGHEVIGQFQSYEEIYNSEVYYGPGTLPGDFKYLDWNKDGLIDDNDIHPIRNNDKTPKIYFGLSAGVNYRKFDLNLLFQGAALVNVIYPEQLAAPLAWDGSALDYFMDRWRPVDPLANPFDPNTEWVKGKYPYGGITAVDNSTFRILDASYLRLKSIEIGYTLPRLRGVKQARIYVNGYNLLTWSGIKYVDPEHPSDTYGYIYPLNKTFNVGVNITF